MRSTKIVCTIGPASESVTVLEQLVTAGMNVARLNFSHGSREEHAARIRNIRGVSERLGRPVGILVDIQGPKIRIGDVPSGAIDLNEGDRLTLTSDKDAAGPDLVYVGYPDLLTAVRPGATIYLDDGLIELVVEEVKADRLECRVVLGGILKSRKGVSLPGVAVDLPPLTDTDKEHVRFAVEQGVDFIAASFVRRAEHVDAVKQLIADLGGHQAVIAKIENAEGVANVDEIIDAADGVMVARGDLGVEMPPEDVPIVQKQIITKCNRKGKVVITATQMLDSMVRSPRPTRAEVTDVCNAIFEGSDAIMLSGETAVGVHPARVVRVMDRIARRAEEVADYSTHLAHLRARVGESVAEAIALATSDAAQYLGVKAIMSITRSGATARLISKYRPHMPILAFTPSEQVARQLTLSWGVHPFVVPRESSLEATVESCIVTAVAKGAVEVGDIVAIVAGTRAQAPGATNSLQVQTVTLNSATEEERRP